MFIELHLVHEDLGGMKVMGIVVCLKNVMSDYLVLNKTVNTNGVPGVHVTPESSVQRNVSAILEPIGSRFGKTR